MFGYVEPDKAQLRLWEYEQYRAVYCGLCRSMGKHTGEISRLTLNYDHVFLAMLRTALTETVPEFYSSRCALHPLKRRAIAKDDTALEYCAEVSVMLTYYKLLDDIADSHGLRRFAASMTRPLCASVYKKCKSLHPLGEKTGKLLDEMNALEKAPDPTPDALAELFGSVMSEVLAYGIDDQKKHRIAYEIGRHIGRYVYLADALDDIPKDIRTGEFNPFVKAFGEKNALCNTDLIKNAVLLELTQLEAAIALVDFSTCPGYGNIINNVIYLGMPRKIDEIIKCRRQDELKGKKDI